MNATAPKFDWQGQYYALLGTVQRDEARATLVSRIVCAVSFIAGLVAGKFF